MTNRPPCGASGPIAGPIARGASGPGDSNPSVLVPRTSQVLATVVLAMALAGCTGYAKMIDGLNARQINSCVEANLTVSTGLLLTGTAHIYTATGGMRVDECIRQLENRPAEWQLANDAERLDRLTRPSGAPERDRAAWDTYMRGLVRDLLPTKEGPVVP